MIFFKNVFLFGPLFDFLYEKILFNSQNSRTRKNFQNRDSEFNFLKFLDPVHRRNFIRVAKNPSSWFSSTSKTKSKKFRKKSKFWCKHHFWTKISEKLMEKVHIFKNDHFKYIHKLYLPYSTFLKYPQFQSKYPHLVNKFEYKSSSGEPKSRAYKRLKLGQNVFWKFVDVYAVVTWFWSWEIFSSCDSTTWNLNVLFEIENQFLNNFCQTHWIFSSILNKKSAPRW